MIDNLNKIILLVGVSALGWVITFFAQPKKLEPWEKIKNLLCGSIESTVEEMPEAYELFKSMQGIRILSVEDQMDRFKRIRIQYIFNEGIEG